MLRVFSCFQILQNWRSFKATPFCWYKETYWKMHSMLKCDWLTTKKNCRFLLSVLNSCQTFRENLKTQLLKRGIAEFLILAQIRAIWLKRLGAFSIILTLTGTIYQISSSHSYSFSLVIQGEPCKIVNWTTPDSNNAAIFVCQCLWNVLGCTRWFGKLEEFLGWILSIINNKTADYHWDTFRPLILLNKLSRQRYFWKTTLSNFLTFRNLKMFWFIAELQFKRKEYLRKHYQFKCILHQICASFLKKKQIAFLFEKYFSVAF